MDAINVLRKQQSFIGRGLFYIGAAMIVLGILNFLLSFGDAIELMEYGNDLASLSLTMTIVSLVGCIIAGFLFFGFSEVIRLLGAISQNSGSAGGKHLNAPGELPRL